MSELKPCPFCGGESEVVELESVYLYGFVARCANEDCIIVAETDMCPTEAEAVEAWNTRAERTCETCPQMDNPDSFIRHLMGRGTCELEELARDMYKALVMMIAVPSYADAHSSELEAIDDRAHSLGVVVE